MDLCLETYVYWLVDYIMLKFPQTHAQEIRHRMDANFKQLLFEAQRPCGPDFLPIQRMIRNTPINQLPERLYMYMYEDPFINEYMQTFYGDWYDRVAAIKKNIRK